MPSFDGIDEWRNRKPPYRAALIFAYAVVAVGVAVAAYVLLTLLP